MRPRAQFLSPLKRSVICLLALRDFFVLLLLRLSFASHINRRRVYCVLCLLSLCSLCLISAFLFLPLQLKLHIIYAPFYHFNSARFSRGDLEAHKPSDALPLLGSLRSLSQQGLTKLEPTARVSSSRLRLVNPLPITPTIYARKGLRRLYLRSRRTLSRCRSNPFGKNYAHLKATLRRHHQVPFPI